MDSKYRRTRILYNKYDEIGCGHQIHIDEFEDEATDLARESTSSKSSSNLLTVGRDSESMTSHSSTYTKLSARTTHSRINSAFPSKPIGLQAPRTKSAFPTLPRNSSFQGVKDKRKTSLTFRTTAQVVMALSPEIKGAAPSFPTVPDSPEFIPPQAPLIPPAPLVTLRQVILVKNILEHNLSCLIQYYQTT